MSLLLKKMESKQSLAQSPFQKIAHLLPGLLFTSFFATISWGLTYIPVFQPIGAMTLSILFAILFRHFIGYPEKIKGGIDFTAKKLLRLAIILFGVKLNIHLLIQKGVELLLIDALVITFSIFMTVWIAKLLKANLTISLLLGVGTGVCGAAAILAVSPILRSKDEDTALSVGMIALIGTVFALFYSFLQPFLSLTNYEYGIWSGVSLHELAHVALATSHLDQDILAIAFLAKLGRVFLLIPLCFLLLYWVRNKEKNEQQVAISFPWFLIGFIVMSIVGSLLSTYPFFNMHIFEPMGNISSFLLTMAMVGLGLNVNLRELKSKALKPFLSLVITSILLSFLTFLIVQ